SPFRADAVRELATVRTGSRGVECEDRPAARGEDVAIEVPEREEVPREARGRPVDIDQERRRAAPLAGQEQPALERAAVRTRESTPLAVDRSELREDLLVELREPALAAAFPVGDVEIRRCRWVARSKRDPRSRLGACECDLA